MLDLFCGAGGAAKGYHDAGFEVVGVDVRPQRHYPYEFVQDDALDFLADHGGGWAERFDAIHASPPCKAYTEMRRTSLVSATADYPDLLTPTRAALAATGLPFVIENVLGAPLIEPVLVCGSMFDPPLDVKRHRFFEANWPLAPPTWPCRHKLWAPHRYPGNRSDGPKARARVVIVAGHDSRDGVEVWRRAMEIDWMTRDELAEAIPPRYTAHVGRELLDYLERKAA